MCYEITPVCINDYWAFPQIQNLISDHLCFRPEAADIDQWKKGNKQVFNESTVE